MQAPGDLWPSRAWGQLQTNEQTLADQKPSSRQPALQQPETANRNWASASGFTSVLAYWDSLGKVDVVLESYCPFHDLGRFYLSCHLYFTGTRVITMKWNFGLEIFSITQFHCIIITRWDSPYSLSFRVKIQSMKVYHKVWEGSLWAHYGRKSGICTLICKGYISEIVIKNNRSTEVIMTN